MENMDRKCWSHSFKAGYLPIPLLGINLSLHLLKLYILLKYHRNSGVPDIVIYDNLLNLNLFQRSIT
ncbi:hypothetical protein BpHYR1_011478 [Brachionus plicatilis]|uniref:Uncharacterized protein n=1 Tax=Brachionus plicatilis TaxID=10195 RepID=A0A3M7QEU7_BRAPC|nr:hypothetical protein BpHYR1_011478 [Brachionus plicatilis]